MIWQPILVGQDSDNAKKKLDEITEILLTSHIDIQSESLLSKGKSAFALYFLYLNKIKKTNFLNEHVNKLLSESLNIGISNSETPSFCKGIGGVLWLLEHTIKNSTIYLTQPYDLSPLTKRLNEYTKQLLNAGNYDYLHGGLGLFQYLLERDKINDDEIILCEFIDILYEKAIVDDKFAKWGSTDHTKEIQFNLGLSHGIPSIIVILSMCLNYKVKNEKIEILITKAINWLIEQKNPIDYISCYPNTIKLQEINHHNSRLAWCYGDLGIAITLLIAGKTMKNKQWFDEGIRIGLNSTKRKGENTSVIDAGFCHGSIGVAHIYNRMFHYTGISDFKKSSIYWYRDTLKKSHQIDGLAGYLTWAGNKGWIISYDIIDGIAGIGLSLISACHNIEPKWDKAFLLSV